MKNINMHMISREGIAVAVLLSMVAAGGCQRRPLSLETGELYVALDIDYDVKYEPDYMMPDAYRILFYDASTGAYVTEGLVSRTGGKVSCPAGTYDILAQSLGAEYTRTRETGRWEDLSIYTDPASGAMPQFVKENNPVEMPDICFAAVNDDEVIPARSTAGSVHTIYMHGCSPVETGRIIVRNVKGAKYISNVTAYVTDLASAKSLVLPPQATKGVTSGVTYGPSATIPVTLDIDTRTGELSSVFCSFGKMPDDGKLENSLILLIEDVNENKYMKIYDVTDQVKASDTHDIIIIVEDSEIDIPDPQGEEAGGMQPIVGEWEDIIIPVPVS